MKKLLKLFDDNLLKWGVFLAVIFIPLYPKIPTIHINHVWVYVRLEDFLILFLSLVWLIQIIRKKINFYWILFLPIFLYWFFGFLSVLNAIFFIGPHLLNFFPKIAFLSYMRHIEYMALFPISYSAINSKNDIKSFVKILSFTMIGIIVYGIGQKYYIYLWDFFPSFFEKYSFCFPSFQTGNEQFAKGLALCLPSDGRITSTFGGHYDLAAFMVMVLPIFASLSILAKKNYQKFLYFLIFTGGLILLIFTSSRISFIAYILGIFATFVFLKIKKWFAPFLLISIFLLLLFNGSTAKRFLETIRFTSIVTNNQGQVVGVAENSLPSNLKNKISKDTLVIEGNVPSQNLPVGSGYITLSSGGTKTSVAVVKKSLSLAEQKQLKLANGGVRISTVSGSFLIQKVLVYDISFTTRFQSEWPTAWKAFLRNQFLGSGFSTISLATDGEYFRILGESGVFGMLSLFLIFVFIGSVFYEKQKYLTGNLEKSLVLGLAGGTIGVLINGTFIDVLEASKVAETMWIFLGIAVAISMLANKNKIYFKKYLKSIFSNNILISFYIAILAGIIFMPHISNFFTADDFSWLKWAASSSAKDLFLNFINAKNFFYRPLDKDIMYVLYAILSFNPEGFRIFIYCLNFLSALGVYFLMLKLKNKKLISFLGAILFLFNPSHAENIYWIATISTTLSSVFILFGLVSWLSFRQKNNFSYYFLSLILFILSLLSYEMSVIFILLALAYDLIFYCHFSKSNETSNIDKGFWKSLIYQNNNYKLVRIIEYLPLIFILIAYFLIRYFSHTVAAGGDYSYNLKHLLANFFGNSFGYLFLSLFGEGILPFYIKMRFLFKAYALPITLILFILGIIVSLLIYKFKNNLKFRNNIFIFSAFFFLISLLPFLGLGNIAQRYDFLASAGTMVFLILIIENFSYLFFKNIKALILFIFITVIIITGYIFMIFAYNIQWKKAGKITYNALAYLRLNIPNPARGGSFYFINTPIRYDNSWVFPLGLKNGMWFIYRNNTLKVTNVNSVLEAKSQVENLKNENYYILEFNKNYNLNRL